MGQMTVINSVGTCEVVVSLSRALWGDLGKIEAFPTCANEDDGLTSTKLHTTNHTTMLFTVFLFTQHLPV